VPRAILVRLVLRVRLARPDRLVRRVTLAHRVWPVPRVLRGRLVLREKLALLVRLDRRVSLVLQVRHWLLRLPIRRLTVRSVLQ
jgi:hypothetical protein